MVTKSSDDDDFLPEDLRRNAQRLRPGSGNGEVPGDEPETEGRSLSFGIIGTKPQLGITFVDAKGVPVMIPYSWLSYAEENKNGHLVIHYANDLRVTVEGRGLCRPYRKSALDYIRQHRLAFVEVNPRAEFMPDGEAVVMALRVEEVKTKG